MIILFWLLELSVCKSGTIVKNQSEILLAHKKGHKNIGKMCNVVSKILLMWQNFCLLTICLIPKHVLSDIDTALLEKKNSKK